MTQRPGLELQPLADGFLRIAREDRLAVLVVLALVILQLGILLRAWYLCRTPLSKARKNLKELSGRLGDKSISMARLKEAVHRAYPRLQRLWTLYIDDRGDQLAVEGFYEIDAVFDCDALLPASYNPRLDNSAPGLFTGLGILGTFIGLILGFLQVKPDAAQASVSPLLGGMVVAFVNSAVGVAISLGWAWGTRSRRHAFDNAAREFVGQLRSRVTEQRPEDIVIAELREVGERIGGLQEATAESSKELTGMLGERLKEVFTNLVNAPFEQLTRSVVAFESAMKESAAQQILLQGKLQAGAEVLDAARDRIADTMREVRGVLDDLGLAGMRLEQAVTATQAPLELAARVADRTGILVENLERSTDQHAIVVAALTEAAATMSAASTSLGDRAAEYAAATGRLESAVLTIKEASDRAVENTVGAARQELQAAIVALREGLQADTSKTIAAYEAATGRVVEAVDDKMSDLTDRLSAELATLASRLPVEVEQVHGAMKLFREQIAGALRSIDEAVKQLRQEAPNVLGRQLDQYDGALAKAMDHFSGTLQHWNANVDSIAGLANEMKALRPLLLGRDGNGGGPAER